jgi:formylglycine-generating enzyme required for sulfatase activity/tRNA A-37 threonylcarbamoyl transferase component Bud32
MEDLTGRQFGAYQIVKPLGEGGMAAVYQAYQPAVDRYVAVKVLPRQYAADPQFIGRFQREARLLAQLQHPHILPVFDFGETEGYTWLVMPFMEHGTLTDLLKGEPLPLPRVREILTQLGSALNYAHSRGLIHRDVKPSNVLLDESGNCLLSDFGLARMAEASVKLTASGSVLGTPAYMSPEQGAGKAIDGRSDLYSLGVIFYELVTGRVPYNAETPVAVIFKHISDPLPPAQELNPALPEPVQRALLKSLAKRPEDRYATGGELVRALQTAIPAEAQEAIPAHEVLPLAPTLVPGVSPPSAPSASAPAIPAAAAPRPPWLWIAVGALMLLAAGAGLSLLFNGTATPEPTVAPTAVATVAPASATPTSTAPPSPLPTVAVTATPDEAASPIILSRTDGMELVLIPAGEFLMGSTTTDSNAEPHERPQITVALDAYRIDRIEITNAMFQLFADATGYQTEAERTGISFVYDPATQQWSEATGVTWRSPQGPGSALEGRGKHPVVNVTWKDATAYCAWAGRRLPTEAEWEKAARGVDGRLYPWGNEPPDKIRANYERFVGDAVAGNSYLEGASPYGVLHLAGNVWEWTGDYYAADYYNRSAGANPRGPQTGEKRVVRSGSWLNRGQFIRAANRHSYFPDFRSPYLGFRCALSVAAASAAAATPLPIAATPQAGATQVAARDAMLLRFVPAGSFVQGTKDGAPGSFPDEHPERTVTLDAFWIDQTEVTNAMYRQCVEAGACRAPRRTSSGTRPDYFGNVAFSNYPVIYVSWDDARTYCNWAGRRLPTEAEWEKAASGANGRLYPWGAPAPDGTRANFNQLVGDTTPVGSYPQGASPYGVLDLGGNVWEWVNDWYSETYYQTAPLTNPAGPGSGTERGLRGGAFSREARYVRTANRYRNPPDGQYLDVGFRCALSHAEQSAAVTPTRATAPRLTNFRFCDRPCSQAEARTLTVFPERVAEIYFSWEYSGMSPGLEYVRTWSSNGEEWVRYNCRWRGPESGVFEGRLWDQDGLRSGEWTVKVTVPGGFAFSQSVRIEGSYTFWKPAGNLTCPDFR